MNLFTPTDKKLFFSKNDPDDVRLGDVIRSHDSIENLHNQLVILGYSDDRGIQANGGRLGAKEGPTGIRSLLYKLVAPESFRNRICDIGDFLKPTDLATDLANDQFQVIQSLNIINKNGNSILSFGGGHDWAFCDVSSFISTELAKGHRPLVINVDAHLDVRSDKNGVNSGTPFFMALEKYPKLFDLVQIGIQPHCNSKSHLEYCRKNSVKIFSNEHVHQDGILAIADEILRTHHSQSVFLSLDIDAISATEAPGCSQSWPGGMSLLSVRQLLNRLSHFKSWNHLGIYEVSPPLDVQYITQKSAALAAYEFLQQKLGHHGI